MDSITPELLEIKSRLDAWRAERKHIRQPLPAELKNDILELCPRYSLSILRRVLKIDPWKLNRTSDKASQTRRAVRKSAATAFFKLPDPAAAPAPSPSCSPSIRDCRLQLERPDGTRLSLTLPTPDLSIVQMFVAELLKGSHL